MKIETKYNIGDVVSYRPEHSTIILIDATIQYIDVMLSYHDKCTITYIMDNDEWVTEDRILPK